jgi:hypothetical protein
MNIQLKPMILVFENHGKTWSKTVKDLNGTVIHTSSGGLLLPEYNNKEYFDQWEAQIRKLPVFNIVDCERFV